MLRPTFARDLPAEGSIDEGVVKDSHLGARGSHRGFVMGDSFDRGFGRRNKRRTVCRDGGCGCEGGVVLRYPVVQVTTHDAMPEFLLCGLCPKFGPQKWRCMWLEVSCDSWLWLMPAEPRSRHTRAQLSASELFPPALADFRVSIIKFHDEFPSVVDPDSYRVKRSHAVSNFDFLITCIEGSTRTSNMTENTEYTQVTRLCPVLCQA